MSAVNLKEIQNTLVENIDKENNTLIISELIFAKIEILKQLFELSGNQSERTIKIMEPQLKGLELGLDTLEISGNINLNWSFIGLSQLFFQETITVKLAENSQNNLIEVEGKLSDVERAILLKGTFRDRTVKLELMTELQDYTLKNMLQLSGASEIAVIPSLVESLKLKLSLTKLLICKNHLLETSFVTCMSIDDNRPQKMFNVFELRDCALITHIKHQNIGKNQLNSHFTAYIKANLELSGQSFPIQLKNMGFGNEELTFDTGLMPGLTNLVSLVGLPEILVKNFTSMGLGEITITEVVVGIIAASKTINYVSVTGRIELFNTTVIVTTVLPDFNVLGHLDDDSSIDIKHIFQHFGFAQANFPDLSVNKLSFTAHPKINSYSFLFKISGDIPIPIGSDNTSLQQLALEAGFTDNNLTGKISGMCSIAGVETGIAAKLPESDLGWVFAGSLPCMELSAILEQYLPDLGVKLPVVELGETSFLLSTAGKISIESSIEFDFTTLLSELKIPPLDGMLDIKLDRVAIELDAKQKSWSIVIESSQSHQFPSGSKNFVALSEIRLKLFGEEGKGTATELSLNLDGAVTPAEGFSLELKNINFNWQSATSSWSAEGEVVCALFSKNYQLLPAIEIDAKSSSLALRYKTPVQVDIIDKIAAITINDIHIFVETKKTESQKTLVDWGLSGKCLLDLKPLFNQTAAELSLQAGDSGAAIGFSIGNLSPINLALLGDVQAKIALLPFDISYSKKTDESAQWQAHGGGTLCLLNIPDVLANYFPIEELTIELGFEASNFYIKAPDFSIKQSLPQLRVKLPGDLVIDLGQPAVQIDNLSLQFGKDLQLSQRLSVSGLKEINRIFGHDEQGNPSHIILKPECGAELSISPNKGLKLKLTDTPFNAIKTHQIDSNWWTEVWDVGGIAKLSIQIPEFAFDTTKATWSASGGIVKEKGTDFKFPLLPFKFLMRLLQVPKEAIDVIPDGIPIRAPGGQVQDLIKDLLGLASDNNKGNPAIKLLNEVADKIGEWSARLPQRFSEYISAEIPDGFNFKIETSTTGNIKFDLNMGAPNDPDPIPLRFMLPCAAPLPELMGFTLRKISVGELFGGSIILLEIDGYVDRFPLADMILGCVSPKEILSDENAVKQSNRIICQDVTALIPAATGFPLPIPMFYGEIGIEFYHLTGLELQSHFRLPKPEAGFIEAIQLLSRLVSFLSIKDYLLHTQKTPEKLDLKFTLGKNYIALPGFIKAEPMGLTQELEPISAYKNVSRLLDCMKTGNMGYLIEAIPLRVGNSWIRVNKFLVEFGPLVFEAAWCITTEKEFVETVLVEAKPAGKLPDNIDKSVLKSLPTEPGTTFNDKGFIILLMGGIDLGPVAGLHAQFGMALTQGTGFQTGFRLTGSVGQTLMLEISGRVEAGQGRVAIAGSVGLLWGDKPLFVTKGEIAVSKQMFSVKIICQLSPLFEMGGLLEIGAKGFKMEGTVYWRHGDQPKSGYKASLVIDNTGLNIGFAIKLLEFGAKVDIRTPSNPTKPFLAKIKLDIPLSLSDGLAENIKSLAEEAVTRGVNKAYDDVQSSIKELGNLEIDVAGIRKWLPALCESIVKIVDNNIVANTKGWRSPGRPIARQIAKPYIARVHTLKNVALKSSDKKIRPQLKKALQDILEHNRLRARVPIPTPWKKYYITAVDRNLMDAEQVENLKEAVNWIDRLPDKSNIVVNNQKIYDNFPDKKKMLGKIHRDVVKGIDGAIPKIKSLSFETRLEVFNASSIRLSVEFTVNNKPQYGEIEANLGKPEQILKSLVKSLLPG